MSMLTVVVPLTLQASRFLFFWVALWNYCSFGEENLRKFDISKTGTQCQPTSLTTAEYCSMEKHWKCSKQHLEAQIWSNNVTVTQINNTMREVMTSRCPTDVGEVSPTGYITFVSLAISRWKNLSLISRKSIVSYLFYLLLSIQV